MFVTFLVVYTLPIPSKSCPIRIYSVCLWEYDVSDPTLVDLTSNYFVLCTNMNVFISLFIVGGA